MASIEQARAALAWDLVEQVAKKSKEDRKTYRTAVRGLPAMLQATGIATTYAYLRGKDDGRKMAADHLAAWLKVDSLAPVAWTQSDADLLKRLRNEPDQQVWWQAGDEAQVFATWLKRFAEARIDSDGGLDDVVEQKA